MSVEAQARRIVNEAAKEMARLEAMAIDFEVERRLGRA